MYIQKAVMSVYIHVQNVVMSVYIHAQNKNEQTCLW